MATISGGSSDTCSICLEKFNQPKILPCFHTFCCACLKTVVSKSSDNQIFHCPTCRYEVTIPQNGVEAFQTNFYIEARLEKNAQKEDACCDVCDQKASHICHECEFLLCDLCVKNHKAIPATKEHALVQLGDQSEGKTLISKEAFCEKHNTEKLRFYCCPCDKVICLHCKLTDHEGHKSKDICDVVSAARTSLLETKVKLETYLTEIEESFQFINTVHDNITNILDRVSVEINQTGEELVNKILSITNDGTEKLNESREMTENSHKDSQVVMEKHQQFLHSQIDHINDLLRDGMDCHVLAADGQMKRRLTEVQTMDFSIPKFKDPSGIVKAPLACLESIRCHVNDTINGTVDHVSKFEVKAPTYSQFFCGNGKIRSISFSKENEAYIVHASNNFVSNTQEYFLSLCSRNAVQKQIAISQSNFESQNTLVIMKECSYLDKQYQGNYEQFQGNYYEEYQENFNELYGGNYDKVYGGNYDEEYQWNHYEQSFPTTYEQNRQEFPPNEIRDVLRESGKLKKDSPYSDVNDNGDKCSVGRNNDHVVITVVKGVSRILDVNPFAKPGIEFKPVDVCWGKHGELYIVDSGSQTVLLYSLSEGFQKTITISGQTCSPSEVTIPRMPGKTLSPSAVTIPGKILSPSAVAIPGKTFSPSAVAMDTEGQLWIGETNGNVSVCNLP